MPKVSRQMFYAVQVGHHPGVYPSWEDCQQQIKGYPRARYKKFATFEEAAAFVTSGSAGSISASAAGGHFVASTSRISTNPGPNHTFMTTKHKAEDVVDESGWDVVYTDGACQNNGKAGAIAGIGVWWGVDHPKNLAERCPGDQTNNRAELIAIIRVLETAPRCIKPLLIKTDSSYSISCVRDWMPIWRHREWKTAGGKDVKNKPVIVYLSHLLDQRARWGQVVRLQHVRGHSGIAGNEGADTLAGIGSLKRALPERDWSLPRESNSIIVGADAISDFQLGAGDLLSSEELARMGASGHFD